MPALVYQPHDLSYDAVLLYIPSAPYLELKLESQRLLIL